MQKNGLGETLNGVSPFLVGMKEEIHEGLHYTVFYSFIFYIPAFIIGQKLKNDFGAKLGRTLSLVTIILLLLSTFFIIK